jgi:hypothetical protein
MNRFCIRVASGVVVAVVGAAVASCGSKEAASPVAGADDRLPADGTPGGPAAAALKTKAIKRADWTRFATERLKPACDARGGAGKPDVAILKSAGEIVTTWMDFTKKAKKGPKTDDGRKLGGGPEPTRSVSTLGMTCSATKNTVEVNGVEHPFDLAWVVSGEGTGPTLTGAKGAGHFAMFQALSLKDKKVLFAKVYVPSDTSDDSDDTVVVSNLTSYMPASADEPIVRTTGEKDSPVFETLVFEKGAAKGFAFEVPKQDPLGRSRYLAVGKFEVVE